uniref:Uncharacterized protein n=1 Tax=Oryza sativa subsp. japonica TaxID=39947 RepID=Q6UUJ3_ORYSJ|nr:hypothetical protein OSJNBa0095C12.3 [Oryza sativa Japonica Group]AAQ56361.1 hypothetical protein OSJNBa0017M13.29 [Oryza sativa Japonica Group]
MAAAASLEEEREKDRARRARMVWRGKGMTSSSIYRSRRIKSTGTLAYPKASFRPALELSRSARPRVFHQHAFGMPGNIVTITPDKLTPDQQKDFDAMMQQARNQFLNSFMQTRKGTVVQKYIVKVVADVPGTGSSKDGEGKQAPDGSAQPSNKGAADGSQGNQGDSSQGVQGVQGDGAHGVQGEGPNQDGNTAQLQFNNFQHQVDYAVHHALINQSGILVNTLSNIVKTMVDGSMAEYQATGPVYLPGGMFPNYRPLITDNQPVVQSISLNAPSAQPTAQVLVPTLAAPPLAPGQLVNPRLLVREQPQHSGQNVNRLTQE